MELIDQGRVQQVQQDKSDPQIYEVSGLGPRPGTQDDSEIQSSSRRAHTVDERTEAEGVTVQVDSCGPQRFTNVGVVQQYPCQSENGAAIRNVIGTRQGRHLAHCACQE